MHMSENSINPQEQEAPKVSSLPLSSRKPQFFVPKGEEKFTIETFKGLSVKRKEVSQWKVQTR